MAATVRPMRAIRISEWGGPEVLELVEDAPRPEADEHHVLVRVTRAGINFADTHARENSYLARYELPFSPGAEIAGVVEEDGGGFRAGERVVALVGTGGYAEYVAAPAATTVAIPGRRQRRDRARAAAAGTDGVAPVTRRRRSSPRARASSCTPRPAGSARSRSSSPSRSARGA